MPSLLIQLGSWDERLLRAVVSQRGPVLDLFMRGVTHLADWPVAVGIALVMALGAVPELRDAGIRMAWTLAVSHLGVQVLKRFINRPRPSLPVGLEWVAEAPDRFSFPSGHATAAISLALPPALVLPGPAAAAVLLLAAAVGISRCYLGVHFPGDVVAGWALGAGVLFAGILTGL